MLPPIRLITFRDMGSYGDWIEPVLARSEPLQQALAWLRAEDQRDRRATSRFCEYPDVAAMEQAIEDALFCKAVRRTSFPMG